MYSDYSLEILKYMAENYGGKCKYNAAKRCDGLCNNCAFEHDRKNKNGNYIPDYSRNTTGKNINFGDYESAILEKQEEIYD